MGGVDLHWGRRGVVGRVLGGELGLLAEKGLPFAEKWVRGRTPARLGEGSAEEHAEISDAGGLRLGGRAGDGKGTGSVSRRWQGMLVGHGPRRDVYVPFWVFSLRIFKFTA